MTSGLGEFKARLPIVDIVRRYVRLTRNGPIWKGLCPFHQEKTPSFTVTESRGTYHCFGCQAHGNGIDFLIAIEGLDFAEAIQRAAELSGLEPPRLDGASETARAERKRLGSALDLATAWYRDALAGAAGADAGAYLDRRGLAPSTVARFELGYAPGGRSTLTRALIARGVPRSALVDAGLTIVPEDGGEPFDRFRDRLMFPIRDSRGQVVGFGGRALQDGAKAKYLNSPEGPLFKKRELLYGANLLDRRAGRGTLHVVEGYMDVIALAEQGIAAVAPLGTAITVEQLQLAWRLEAAPVVCLDGDEAGRRASGRLAEAALAVLRPGLSLRFVAMPPGEDPDSLVRRQGADALAGLVANAAPLVDMLWSHVAGEAMQQGPDARALVRRRLRDLLRQITDRDVREEYARTFKARLDGDGPSTTRPWRPGVARGTALASSLARVERERARALLSPLLHQPLLLARFDEALADLKFEDPAIERLKECLLDYALSEQPLETDAVRTHLQQVGLGETVTALVSGDGSYTLTDASGDELADRYGLLLEHQRLRGHQAAERELLAEALLSDTPSDAGEAVRRSASLDSLLNTSTNPPTESG